MRRVILFGAISLVLCGTAHAQARGFSAGGALLRAGALTQVEAQAATEPSCPAGVPVQTITVVNQANVRPSALAKVENAIVAQSLQLRTAWGTPCVQFERGGWPLYLSTDGASDHVTGPVIDVPTGGLSYLAWSSTFSHEVVEALVDPATTLGYMRETDGVWSGSNLEVADPVQERAYRLDGVYVSDFVLPAYFAGALYMAAGGCDPSQGVACGAFVAPADAPGPYDEMGVLTAPWQGQWGQSD